MRTLTTLFIAAALLAPCSSAAQDDVRSVSLLGNGPKYGSPVIAEVDGDTSNGKEIVVASANGVVSAISAAGDVLWETALPINGCPALSNSNKLLSTPAVGTLRGDRQPFVVVGYGGIGGRDCGGGVVALQGATGEIAWDFDLKAFARRRPIFSVSHAVISSPALHDFDGDGTLEVVFGSLDRNIYMVTATGKLRGYYQAADTVFSSPAIFPADQLGQAEIIVGTDISRNRQLRPPTPNGGYVYALRGDAFKQQAAIGFRATGSSVWRKTFDQVVQSSPTVGELISSNEGLEVVVATGCYFPEDSTDKRGRYMKVLSVKTGKVLRTAPLATCTNSEAAIADVDGDGLNDVVIPVQTLGQYGGSGQSQVVAYNPERDAFLWIANPLVNGSNSKELALFSGLVIADLDTNGSREVVVTTGGGLAVLAGATGEHLSCDGRNCSDGRSTFNGFSSLRNGVAVGDLTNDGTLELVAAGPSSEGGLVQVYSGFQSLISSPPGPLGDFVPWPLYRHDAKHSGVQREN